MGRFDPDVGLTDTSFSNFPDQVRHPTGGTGLEGDIVGSCGTKIEQRTAVLKPVSAIYDPTDFENVIGFPFDDADVITGASGLGNFLRIDNTYSNYPTQQSHTNPLADEWMKSFQFENLSQQETVVGVDDIEIRIGGVTFNSNAGVGQADYAVLLSLDYGLVPLVENIPFYPGAYLSEGAMHVSGKDILIKVDTLPSDIRLQDESLLLSFGWAGQVVDLTADGVEIEVNYSVEVPDGKALNVKICDGQISQIVHAKSTKSSSK